MAAVMYGAADFVGGLASRKASAAFVVLASQVVGLAALAAALALVPGRPYAVDVGWGIAGGVAGAVGIAALYAALARGRMGVVSPITAVVGAAVPVAFGIIAGERPAPAALAGVAFAFVAVVLVSISPETGRFSLREPGVALATLSGLAIGVFYVFMSRGHPDAGLWLLVPTRLTSIALLAIFSVVTGVRVTLSRRLAGAIVLSGALDMGANLLYVLAVQRGMLAIAAILTSLYPAATVFLARVFLDERLSALQWVGVASALIAVTLIAA